MKTMNVLGLALLFSISTFACKSTGRRTRSDIMTNSANSNEKPVDVRCLNTRPHGLAEPAGYRFKLDKLRGFNYAENLDLDRLLDLESNLDLSDHFSHIDALKDGDLNKSFSLSEIREIESYGLLCDLNDDENGFFTSRGNPIFGMPMGRRMLVFAYHPGPTSTIMTPHGSVPTTMAGTYRLVGDIPMFTGANLNVLAKSLPFFRDADQSVANNKAAALEFALHLVPFGTARDQIATKGELDRDGIVSIFLDSATVLTLGTFGAAGTLTKFEKAAVYTARSAAVGGFVLGATEISDKLRTGDRKGAGVAALKVSFIGIANAVALMRIGKGFEKAAENIIHPVDVTKVIPREIGKEVVEKAVVGVAGLIRLAKDSAKSFVGVFKEETLATLQRIASFPVIKDADAFAPKVYNEAYSSLVSGLSMLVKQGSDKEVQLAAMETLVAFGKRHSDDYTTGYMGRMLAEVIPDLANNSKLPVEVIEMARRENAILYKNLGWGAPKYAASIPRKNPAGFGIPDSISVNEAGHVVPDGSGFFKEELYLITPAQLKSLSNGTTLTCIDGKRVVVGIDKIDDDTRGGFLAYGFSKLQ